MLHHVLELARVSWRAVGNHDPLGFWRELGSLGMPAGLRFLRRRVLSPGERPLFQMQRARRVALNGGCAQGRGSHEPTIMREAHIDRERATGPHHARRRLAVPGRLVPITLLRSRCAGWTSSSPTPPPPG
jgi:hypothetical protein